MRVLRDILQDKEASIKRLEKEVEAIRMVLAMLEEQARHSNTESQDSSGQVMWELGMDVTEVMKKATSVPDVVPPVSAPFSASAAAVGAASSPVLKPVTKTWP